MLLARVARPRSNKSRWLNLAGCLLMVVGCNAPQCIEVGNYANTPIDGNHFLSELVAHHGRQFAQTYLERRILDEKAAHFKVSTSHDQVNSQLALLQRNFQTNHGGEEGMKAHLADYGMTLDAWRKKMGERIKYDLLTREVMKIEPGESLLNKTFEKSMVRVVSDAKYVI